MPNSEKEQKKGKKEQKSPEISFLQHFIYNTLKKSNETPNGKKGGRESVLAYYYYKICHIKLKLLTFF